MGQVAVVETSGVFSIAADEVCFVCGRHFDVGCFFFWVQWRWFGMTVGLFVSGAR